MDNRDRRRFLARVRVLLVLFLVGLGLVVARAVELQVQRHDSLAKMAREQYLKDVQVPAKRGTVYDRTGKPLAVSVDVPSVYANPSKILDPRKAARTLAPLLGVELDTVYQRLASERLFVWMKRQVTPEIAAKVEALGLPGVGITKESKRFYPNRELLAQVLGFTGVDGRGLEGIERAFNEQLTGEPQVVEVERDARGRAVLLQSLDPKARTTGDDLTLTIDASIQHTAEVATKRAVQSSNARSAMAVVLDVETAEILAMAVQPSFNANVAADVGADKRRNRAVTDVFEPASTMKPLVVAAALDQKVVRDDAVFFCENGAMTIGKHRIRDVHPYGWLSLTGIIQKSSNICAAKVGKLLGGERLYDALRSFGFGQKTQALPGEVNGMLRPPRQWSEVGLATISYGHGIAVTALQLAAAHRVLAAGGIYRTPSLVPNSAVSEHRVVSAAAAAKVRAMMEAAVGSDGTGALATVPGHRVAGKTGTAIKIDPVLGGYAQDKYVASFAGFLPADAPRVVVVVVVDEPNDGHTGGAIAAPVFAEIGVTAMRVLGVLPSGATAAAPRLLVTEEAALDATTTELQPAAPIAAGAVPSFVGLTARQAVQRFSDLRQGMDLALEGSGRVVKQDPIAGSVRTDVTRLTLVLSE